MPISHHLDDATLMSYASGTLPEALSAVVAAHLAVCPDCQEELRFHEAIGGALFNALQPSPHRAGAPGPSGFGPAVVAAMQAPVLEPVRIDTLPSDVPAPLQDFVGHRLEDIPWRRLGLGVWHYPLPVKSPAGGDLRLLKVAPNCAMPDHGHGGSELTLVLQGAYSDKTGSYAAGDVADLDETIEHQPIADPTVGCICLIASEKPARFNGWLGRLIQPFARM